MPPAFLWRFLLASILLITIVQSSAGRAVSISLAGRSLLQNGALTFLPASAAQQGAVCLDGSTPAYEFEQGSGSGQNNWIVHLQGGGWCGNDADCLSRSTTALGSSTYMSPVGLSGFLSNSPTDNPDFYNWNRVFVRYCDGGSFSGNVASGVQVTGSDGQMHTLFYRGQSIWEAAIDDLLSKGMMNAAKAIHSGDSAGSLAAFFHCNSFRDKIPTGSQVACLCDGGFFMDAPDLAGEYSFRSFFQSIVALHNINILPGGCTSQMDIGQCFFPQYNLAYITVPLFILQSLYDYFQVQYILAPSSSYSNGSWDACKQNIASCSTDQLGILQAYRGNMLAALHPLVGNQNWGLHLVSCYYHTQTDYDTVWDGTTVVNTMNDAVAFHNWFFGGMLIQDIDCEYPCNPTCVGL